MAATPAKYPISPSPAVRNLNPKLSLSIRISFPDANFPKSHNRISLHSCSSSISSDETPDRISGKSKKTVPAIELQKLSEDNPYELSSKDSSNSLPSSKSLLFVSSLIIFFVWKFSRDFRLISEIWFFFPGPLTSAHLSNMASEGARLRVAYQVFLLWNIFIYFIFSQK